MNRRGPDSLSLIQEANARLERVCSGLMVFESRRRRALRIHLGAGLTTGLDALSAAFDEALR